MYNGAQHRIPSATHKIDIYQVYHGVGFRTRVKSQWTVLVEYLTISICDTDALCTLHSPTAIVWNSRVSLSCCMAGWPRVGPH